MVKSYWGDVMEQVFATPSENEEINIICFGRETESENARWGRGCRDVVLLHYVFSGEGYFNDNRIRTGEGFFIKANESHEYHSSNEMPWSYFWVALTGKRAEEICLKHINVNENGIFECPFLDELIRFSDLVLSEKNGMDALLAMSYFLRLLSLYKQTKRKTNCGKDYVIVAKKYINNNLHRSFSITELAETLFVDDRYLYNLFMKYEGISPKKYSNSVKLNHACRMLKSNKYTVTEVAASVGFLDVFAFSRFFSKNMKISPSEYKNKSPDF